MFSDKPVGKVEVVRFKNGAVRVIVTTGQPDKLGELIADDAVIEGNCAFAHGWIDIDVFGKGLFNFSVGQSDAN